MPPQCNIELDRSGSASLHPITHRAGRLDTAHRSSGRCPPDRGQASPTGPSRRCRPLASFAYGTRGSCAGLGVRVPRSLAGRLASATPDGPTEHVPRPTGFRGAGMHPHRESRPPGTAGGGARLMAGRQVEGNAKRIVPMIIGNLQNGRRNPSNSQIIGSVENPGLHDVEFMSAKKKDRARFLRGGPSHTPTPVP